MLKNLSLENCILVPFNPENPKSRIVDFFNTNDGGKDKSIINIHFDMSVENPPECVAVAVILPKIHENKKVVVYATPTNSTKVPEIYLELKKGNQKYFEKTIKFLKGRTIEIYEDTSEIVFNCWRSINELYKGDIIVNFYEVL